MHFFIYKVVSKTKTKKRGGGSQGEQKYFHLGHENQCMRHQRQSVPQTGTYHWEAAVPALSSLGGGTSVDLGSWSPGKAGLEEQKDLSRI